MEPEGRLAGKFTLRWTAPPGWEVPPGDFVPDLQWRPNRYWPEPPEDWEFWQIIADDEIVDLFHQPIAGVPRDPEPIWVAPPSWPAPPEGWHPPSGWTPDRTWTPEPLGWQFWQQPEVDHRAKSAALLATRSGQLLQLNGLESLFRTFAEHLLFAESDTVKRQLALVQTRGERRRRQESLRAAHEAASEALMKARQGLLWALSGDRPADDATVEWQALVVPRIDMALGWTYHVLMRRREESAEALRLRLLNSLPYGATDTIPSLDSGAATDEIEVLPGALEWQEAERLAAMALRQFGFLDAVITEAGADGGIDVRASRIVAQVKYTSKPVGRPILQQLVGAADGRAAACFALSGFTEQALEFANQRSIALFTVRLPTTVRPENSAARLLADASAH